MRCACPGDRVASEAAKDVAVVIRFLFRKPKCALTRSNAKPRHEYFGYPCKRAFRESGFSMNPKIAKTMNLCTIVPPSKGYDGNVRTLYTIRRLVESPKVTFARRFRSLESLVGD
jgi:hypothetical protein